LKTYATRQRGKVRTSGDLGPWTEPGDGRSARQARRGASAATVTPTARTVSEPITGYQGQAMLTPRFGSPKRTPSNTSSPAPRPAMAACCLALGTSRPRAKTPSSKPITSDSPESDRQDRPSQDQGNQRLNLPQPRHPKTSQARNPSTARTSNSAAHPRTANSPCHPNPSRDIPACTREPPLSNANKKTTQQPPQPTTSESPGFVSGPTRRMFHLTPTYSTLVPGNERS